MGSEQFVSGKIGSSGSKRERIYEIEHYSTASEKKINELAFADVQDLRISSYIARMSNVYLRVYGEYENLKHSCTHIQVHMRIIIFMKDLWLYPQNLWLLVNRWTYHFYKYEILQSAVHIAYVIVVLFPMPNCFDAIVDQGSCFVSHGHVQLLFLYQYHCIYDVYSC